MRGISEESMSTLSPRVVTQLIEHARNGDQHALDQLLPHVYGELRRIAGRYVRRERQGGTLQTTALVHEAYVRLARDTDLSFENRAHLLGIAARAMREILVERARARGAQKRGGRDARVTLDEGMLADAAEQVDTLALHAALEKLAGIDGQQEQIVELRFFGGLTIEETAEVLAISPATVKRGWAVARAWLYREIGGR
jgi:RNA polymerase sigma factor (TIGR02999 family)